MERIQRITAGMKQKQFSKLLEIAASAALEAGEILRNLYNKPLRIRHKGLIDLVTEADVTAEDLIISTLKKNFPKITIIAEESSPHYNDLPTGETWIIDPLDGTTNYAHGFPWFGSSIAYAVAGEPQVGVIYCPMQDELFYSWINGGAWLNGNQLRVSKINLLQHSLVGTGFPYDIHQDTNAIMAPFTDIIGRVQDIRRAGAAALDLAYVACGRLDGFWESKLKPWDTAAGQLLVQEAGGMITKYNGDTYSPFDKEILASNGIVHNELVDILNNFTK